MTLLYSKKKKQFFTYVELILLIFVQFFWGPGDMEREGRFEKPLLVEGPCWKALIIKSLTVIKE